MSTETVPTDRAVSDELQSDEQKHSAAEDLKRCQFDLDNSRKVNAAKDGRTV